jgi:hypothetical protein
MLSSHLRIGLPKDLFPSVLPIGTLYIFLIHPFFFFFFLYPFCPLERWGVCPIPRLPLLLRITIYSRQAGFWLGGPKVRGYWKDLDVGGKITLRWTLGRQESMGRTGFSWLRIGCSGGFVSTVMNLRVL